MKSRDEVEALKANWRADPCYDLEDAEGFEGYRDELLGFREVTEAKWALQAHTRRSMRARELGVESLDLVAYLETLEARIAALEEVSRLPTS